jgi:hypothetical protein
VSRISQPIIKFPSKTISSARLYLGLTNSEFCTAVANPKLNVLVTAQKNVWKHSLAAWALASHTALKTTRQPGNVMQPIASRVQRVSYRAWRCT